ncbi:MAG: response regulator [Vicinamibacterales bacterium]
MTGAPLAGTTLRILLVDDHPVVRLGLRHLLADAFASATIQEGGSAAEAMALVTREAWDVVILDLTLPDGSGLDVLKQIRSAYPRLPVLILSIHTVDQFGRRALAAGASGYVTKDAADAELVTAVTRVIRGGKHFDTAVLEHIALGLHPDGMGPPHERLSDREYQVLRMIGSGRTVSQVAAELKLSIKTVSTYRARVLEKMDMRTNAELIHYSVRAGLSE